MAADPRELSLGAAPAAGAEHLLGLFADWYWVLDRDLRYVHISGQGDQRNKVNAASLLGQRRFEGREFEPLDMTKAEFERLHAEGRGYRDVRARIRVGDGSHHYVAISGEPLRDADGELTGYHGVTRDITKEYLTQAALAESEARFRSLANLSSDFYWETDAAHRFVRRHWGEGNALAPMLPDAVALGKRRWELPSLSPDAAGWRALQQEMDAHRPFRGFEFSRRDSEGVVRHFAISGEPVLDSRGAFTGYRGVGTDITARKHEERLLALEHEVTRRLALAPGAAEGLREVMRAICEAQGWDYGRYWKLDEAAGVLRFGGAWSIPDPGIQCYLEESRELTFAPGVAIVGEVLRTGEPALVPDLAKDGRLQQQALAERAGLRGACNFAVSAQGRTVGVFAFVGRLARRDDPRLLLAMGAIGRQVGEFLRRKEAEDELRASEARFRSLIALSTDFYWETDREHRITLREGGVARALDEAGGAAIFGQRRWELPSVEPDAAGWAAHRADLEARRAFKDFQFGWKTAEGGVIHLSISGEPVFDAAGAFAGYRGIGSDITARKREARLVALEHEVTRRLAEAPDAGAGARAVLQAVCEAQDWAYGRFWRLDPGSGKAGLAAQWSVPDDSLEKFLRDSGGRLYAPGEGIVGEVLRTGEAQFVPDLRQDARLLQKSLLEREGLRGICCFAVTDEGRTAGVLAFVGREVRRAEPRMLATLAAIGRQVGQFLRRKAAEDDVRASEARFRSLVALSSDFYWETDAEHRMTARSEGGAADSFQALGGRALFGRRRWEMPVLESERALWDAHRAELEAHRPFRDFQYARPGEDGALYYFAISGEPFFGDDGRFLGYRGVGTEITARKREEALRALEHQVAGTLAERGDPARAVERVVQMVCETTGFDCGRFFRLDAATGRMRQAGGWGADPALLERFVTHAAKRDFAPGEGVVGEVWRTARALWIEDIAREPRFVNAAAAGGANLRTGFTVPIAYDGRIEGVLTFLSLRRRAEDPRVLASVGAIAGQLAQYLARERSQEQLRENEERFRNLTELSSDWYWEQDADLRFVNFSGGSIPRKWGVDQLNAIGKRRWEIPGVEAVSCSWDEHQADHAARRPFRDFIYMRVHAETGLPHYVSASGYPEFNAAGRFTGYRGVATDVTERVRGEKLREMEHKVARLLAAGEAPEATLLAVMRAVCETQGVDCGRYYEADQEDETLRFVGGWGVEDSGVQAFLAGSRATLFRRGDRISGVVWDRGEAIWVADVNHDPRTARTPVATSGMRSMLGVPVVSGGRTVGVLSFTSRQMRAPDDALLRALGSIGGQLGQFLGRVRGNARLALHARRQERIAAFGQFALQRHGEDELINAALRALGDEIERAAFFERDPEGHLHLRQGLGPEVAQSVGQSAPLIPGGAALRVLEGGETVRVDEAYFGALPEALPWAGWLRRMRSGVYAPVMHDGHAHGMLAMFDSRPHAYGDDEAHFAETVAHVLSAALQREQAERRLSHMAQFDALTGLPNRTLLEDRLRQTMAQSRRKHWQTGVLFVDLDRFKLVNDTLGHPVGDRMLRDVAQRLQGCVRAGDTVGRISGDEFAVVLADLARPEDAGTVAQKILDALAQPFALEESETFVSASIGISVYPTDGEDADTLLRNADMAMYRAKKASRNAYRFFTAKMNDRTVRKLQLHTDLRRAVERREFSLHYQPKVELAGGALTGLEALLRWTHPRRGAVPPAEFIPALEESGLIIPVGDWVIEEACAQQRRWREAGLAPVPVAVNLSPKQFRKRDLDRVIQRALDRAGLPPALLALEITESSLADDPEDALRILANLRAAGLAISVDDFGTGYSSLAYLTRLPISALKIDRSFVRGTDESPEAVSIVRAIIDMAHNMRFTVVAEGVETEWQAKLLRLYHCDQAQGYLFGRPAPAAETAARLAKAQA